jgi:dUTP pyrophosphatase
MEYVIIFTVACMAFLYLVQNQGKESKPKSWKRVPLKVKRFGDHKLPLPSRGTRDAAGLDIRTTLPIRLAPGERQTVMTGFGVEIPPGHEGTMRPRSSSSKKGLHVCFGTVDADYRGELTFTIQNQGKEVLEYAAGDRIAQLVISPVTMLVPEEVEELSSTARGEGRWGSTGQS